MNAKLKVLIYVVIISTSAFMVFSAISVYLTIVEQKLFENDFCMSSQCLDTFAKKMSGITLWAQAFGWLMTTFVTVFGVIIALMTYYSGVKNNNNSNYTTHLTMFREFASAELSKRTRIYPEGVNFFRWYKVMFPMAKGGDISVSSTYLNVIANIQAVIEEANSHITDENKDYKYKTHQRKMIMALGEIGVCINSGPKNIFIEIEGQVLEYIDTINLSFGYQVVELSKIKRSYT
ncbi:MULTISPECIES: retron Ec48 family effector membrane protein [Enterobacter]|uniref:retron Ec48 family effector membrane protein n=1 Tax=Enterobacter TaxID=547 RepID=UPI002DBC1A3A|nr:retron Ec48 family effector membrane protein [Enterobacter mori]MEB7568454.1 retron Ec48 family effector membrane protein [Enterobacter mori]